MTTLPGLRQPTAARPLTILDVGDSLGEDLGLGLGYTLGTNPLVHLVQAGYGSSGIDRPDYDVRCASRKNASPGTSNDRLGFRCRGRRGNNPGRRASNSSQSTISGSRS